MMRLKLLRAKLIAFLDTQSLPINPIPGQKGLRLVFMIAKTVITRDDIANDFDCRYTAVGPFSTY